MLLNQDIQNVIKVEAQTFLENEIFLSWESEPSIGRCNLNRTCYNPLCINSRKKKWDKMEAKTIHSRARRNIEGLTRIGFIKINLPSFGTNIPLSFSS